MANFYGKSGQKLDNEIGSYSQGNQESSIKKSKNKKTIKVVVTALCCVFIIAAGIFCALKFFGKDTTTDSSNTHEVIVNTDFTPIISDVIDDKSEEGPENDISIYSQVINQYKTAIENNFYSDNEDFNAEFVNIELLNNAGYCDNTKVYYALVDINQDGTDELVIGSSGDGSAIGKYDIFTHDGKNPAPLFDVGTFGYRSEFKLYDNGVIYTTGSGGAELHIYDYYILPKESTKVEHIAGFTCENNIYCESDEEGSCISTISEDEFKAESQKHTSTEFDLEWVEITAETMQEPSSDLPETTESGNQLYGIWYSAEAEKAYIFDSTGNDVYVTGNGIAPVTGTYYALDFKRKESYPGGYDLTDNMALTLYSSKQGDYVKEYNIELNGDVLSLDGHTYNHVSDELQNQFLGRWKNDEGYIEFGEKECVIVKNSKSKKTCSYYVLSDDLVAINNSGNASGSYDRVEYNISKQQLTLNDLFYWKEGSDNSAEVLTGIKNIVVGYWKEQKRITFLSLLWKW